MLATSAFRTAFVTSRKHLEQIEYACERPENKRVFHEDVGVGDNEISLCLGTQIVFR